MGKSSQNSDQCCDVGIHLHCVPESNADSSCFVHVVLVAVATSFASSAAHCGWSLLMEDHLSTYYL